MNNVVVTYEIFHGSDKNRKEIIKSFPSKTFNNF